MFSRIDSELDVLVGNFGHGRSRIVVFRTSNISDDDIWQRVDGAQVLLVGNTIDEEMRKLLSKYGRHALAELIPGGIAGRPHPALRKHVGL